MSLPKQVCEDVLHLCAQSRPFQRLLEYWGKQADSKAMEIMSPMTPIDEREILVRFHDIFKREVIDLPIQARKQQERELTKR